MVVTSYLTINISARRVKEFPLSNGSCQTVCGLFIKNGLIGNYKEIGRSELSDDNHNPDWNKKFLIPYKFNDHQFLNVEIHRLVQLSKESQKIGDVEIKVSTLVTAKDGFIMKTLRGNDRENVGKVLLKVEEDPSCKEVVTMSFNGKNLPKMDIFGKSDPYLAIMKEIDDGKIVEVCRSEIVYNTLDPIWKPIIVRVKTLCDFNRLTPLRFDCYDWNKINDDEFIGSFTTTLEQLLIGQSDKNQYDCINSEKLSKEFNTYTNSGIISLDSIQMTNESTFIDSLRKGIQFHLAVAIDFSSPVPYDKPESPHYLDPNDNETTNAYENIIKNIGGVINDYQYESLLLASGFGAKFSQNDKISHHFPLNYKTKFHVNIENIIADYKSNLSFAKAAKEIPKLGVTINLIMKDIEEIRQEFSLQNNHYFILLMIISEPKICLDDINDALKKCSDLPVSILIIGVGNSNFESVEKFFDGTQLCNKLAKDGIKRNSVKFLSMKKYSYFEHKKKQSDKISGDALNYIPDQYFQYTLFENPKNSTAQQNSNCLNA